eukprot:CAMPEP_0114611690 /NCGR_PEP_ID=MMETSP0168-20121206/4246_1 /TAXON_ID=95228 ORGANISM="Vannella sp., Strain DIVA3 517/6/12" /NCGR_SAMPLE_ID=MMETSP0168 /ASSEMBLY_ACC=CAM_ASM_000044 /LENGTH=543 /DNA_ID=CAMNT_0001822671 /DNA_START=31 /DNA_END=1662 /DNA_ORIENTATION=+
MSAKLVSALMCVLLVSSVAAQVNWNGEWAWRCSSDTEKCFGGTVFTCSDGETIFGEYSGIGYFEGEIDGDIARGNWLEAGYNDNAQGSFTWQLNDDDDAFAGEWWFGDEGCDRFRRDARRELSQADEAHCTPTYTVGDVSIAGHWQNGLALHGIDDLFICVDEDKDTYTASWNINVQGTDGYTVGRTFNDHTILQGSWWSGPDSTGVAETQGIELIRLVAPDTILVMSYEGKSAYSLDDVETYDDFQKHSVSVYTRVGTDNNNCRINSGLVHEDSRKLWQGTFSDHSNGPDGRLYICVDEDEAVGIYSEYGFIDGVIADDNSLSGRWVSSGIESNTQGDFHITLNRDATGFTGSFTIDGVSGSFSWDEVRIDITDENLPEECYILVSGRSSLEGRFVTSGTQVVDFCVDKDAGTIVGSYEIGNSKGTIEGSIFENGKSAQYVWNEELASGIGILRLTDDDLMYDLWWTDPLPDQFYTVCDSDEDDQRPIPYFKDRHDVFEYHRDGGFGDCLRNFNPSESSSSSDASVITFSVVALATVLIALF